MSGNSKEKEIDYPSFIENFNEKINNEKNNYLRQENEDS